QRHRINLGTTMEVYDAELFGISTGTSILVRLSQQHHSATLGSFSTILLLFSEYNCSDQGLDNATQSRPTPRPTLSLPEVPHSILPGCPDMRGWMATRLQTP